MSSISSNSNSHLSRVPSYTSPSDVRDEPDGMATNDPLATLVPQIRFGVKFLQWPVAMLVFNILAVVLALQTSQGYRHTYSIRTSDYFEAMLLDRRTIVLRLALLFLIDAVVLYRMSELLERQMRALRQEETAAEVPSAAVS
jgi:hypothetical protein